MNRIALNLLTALSLLLFVATVALWVRMVCVSDRVTYTAVQEAGPEQLVRYWTFDTASGNIRLSLTWRMGMPEFHRMGSFWDWIRRPERVATDIAPIGFDFTWTVDHNTGTRHRALQFPPWLLPAGSVLLPAFRMYKRVRRHPPGCCPACGYDLRATPDRCPECGTAR